MVIGTFGPTTAWNGKTITFENENFILEGHGTITAQDIVAYAATGHLAWADEGLRQWVETTAAIERDAAAQPPIKGSGSDLSDEDAPEMAGATGSQLLASTVPVESPEGSAIEATLARPDQPAMPDSKGRKVARVLARIVAGLGALVTLGTVLDGAINRDVDLVWYVSVAALALLVAVLVLVGRLRTRRPRLAWLKATVSGILVLAGIAYAAGVGAYFLRLYEPALRASDLAVLIAFWSFAGAAAAVTVLIDDREPRRSSLNPNEVAWRLRWPKWMWVPSAILVLLGASPLAGTVLFGTVAAYLLVWSARRCLPDDGTRLRWPGHGGPAVAGIIGVLLAIPVFVGVMGQYGQIEAQLQTGSTQSGMTASEAPADPAWVAYDASQNGFAFRYPSGLFSEVSDSESLQPIRDVAPGAAVCAFQSADRRSVFAVAARREATTKRMRNAGRAMYEYAATEMAKVLRQQMVGITDVTAQSGRLGGRNGTLITYTKAGEATGEPTAFTWYHLYGRGLIVDVMATRPMAGSSANADSVSRMLKSFRVSD